METNRRYNRRDENEDFRNRQSNHYQRVDENAYRGAYRFDNDSNQHEHTTYDGFDLNDSMVQRDERDNFRNEQHQGGDYVFRRSRNLEDNNRRYREVGRHNDNRDYQGRYQEPERDRFQDRYGDGRSNFNNSYAPDPYRNRNRDENYGNMAGSLSFGYDGDYNSDSDYNRRYDPLSGKIRPAQHHDKRDRHPGKYGPPDRFGINPDYDRY